MMWQIACWVWQVGIFVTAFFGLVATMSDPEIDASEVNWPRVVLAYIFWPVAFLAVLATVA
jgi:hypothetical protein